MKIRSHLTIMSKDEIQEEPLETTEENLETIYQEAEADAEAVENEFDLLQAELTELKDTYARVHADFDNIKKRLEREKVDKAKKFTKQIEKFKPSNYISAIKSMPKQKITQ